MTTAGVVTPEAVRLDFEEANVGSRAVGLMIDAAVQITVLVVLNVSLVFLSDAAGGGLPDWVAITVVLVLNLLVLLGYPVAFETLWRGRTLGKAAMGLRVVTVEGAPVRLRHAALRAALWLVDIPLTGGAGAVISVLASRRNQRLGDMVAGTIVLRERTGARAPQVAQFRMPYGAAGYAATLDPTGLTGQDYDLLRAFLLRARRPDLDPGARRRLAERLATALAAKVGATPSPDVDPETFLAALAARWQERRTPDTSDSARSGGPPRSDAATPPHGQQPPPRPPTAPGDFAPPE